MPLPNETFDFVWNSFANQEGSIAKCLLQLERVMKQLHQSDSLQIQHGGSRTRDTKTLNRCLLCQAYDYTAKGSFSSAPAALFTCSLLQYIFVY